MSLPGISKSRLRRMPGDEVDGGDIAAPEGFQCCQAG